MSDNEIAEPAADPCECRACRRRRGLPPLPTANGVESRRFLIGELVRAVDIGSLAAVGDLAVQIREVEARAVPPTARSRAALIDERSTLRAYLRHRLDREDWHGVMDAAADIREIDAKLAILEGR